MKMKIIQKIIITSSSLSLLSLSNSLGPFQSSLWAQNTSLIRINPTGQIIGSPPSVEGTVKWTCPSLNNCILGTRWREGDIQVLEKEWLASGGTLLKSPKSKIEIFSRLGSKHPRIPLNVLNTVPSSDCATIVIAWLSVVVVVVAITTMLSKISW